MLASVGIYVRMVISGEILEEELKISYFVKVKCVNKDRWTSDSNSKTFTIKYKSVALS